MGRNRNILQFATKFLAGTHERYRGMCSLAAVGQLGGPEMSELNEHIATCASCRSFLEGVAQASVEVLPVLAEDRISATASVPPAGMRARFLARLAAENPGDRLQKSGLKEPFVVTLPDARDKGIATGIEEGFTKEELVFQRVLPGEGDEKVKTERTNHESGFRVWRAAMGIAAAGVLAVGGFYAARRSHSRSPQILAVRTPDNPALPAAAADDTPDRIHALAKERDRLLAELAEMKGKLSASDLEQRDLAEKLEAANHKLQGLEEQEKRAKDGAADGNREAKSQVASLQAELDLLRKQSGDSNAQLASEQKDNEYLRGKLELTEASLQQELAMKDAKSEMGELVAARNLHIVDVYDADPSGKRQRAFGRVFYTEGKSLVFYAYDLEDQRQVKANVVFHVWGGKAGVKEVTHNLGILHKDDDGQSRWKMTFDDAHVLSQINTVFVTAEASGKSLDSPRGKKVLFAYFGSVPNHP